jgi:hypothetical protein
MVSTVTNKQPMISFSTELQLGVRSDFRVTYQPKFPFRAHQFICNSFCFGFAYIKEIRMANISILFEESEAIDSHIFSLLLSSRSTPEEIAIARDHRPVFDYRRLFGGCPTVDTTNNVSIAGSYSGIIPDGIAWCGHVECGEEDTNGSLVKPYTQEFTMRQRKACWKENPPIYKLVFSFYGQVVYLNADGSEEDPILAMARTL